MSDTPLELTPTGKLRVGINFGNALLAGKDENGAPRGIVVDLAVELARRLGVPIEFVTYEAAGKMAGAAKADAWDVAFLAVDPVRADDIVFTPPYLDVDTTYLVPNGSPLRTPADVDRTGMRISVSDKSAYDLFLTRNLKHARLERASDPGASVELFFSGELDALAGIRPFLVQIARTHPGTRVLDEGFATVRQAIGTPRNRSGGAPYLRAFVEEMKSSGFVAKAIQKNDIMGATVAPPSL